MADGCGKKEVPLGGRLPVQAAEALGRMHYQQGSGIVTMLGGLTLALAIPALIAGVAYLSMNQRGLAVHSRSYTAALRVGDVEEERQPYIRTKDGTEEVYTEKKLYRNTNGDNTIDQICDLSRSFDGTQVIGVCMDRNNWYRSNTINFLDADIELSSCRTLYGSQ